MSIRLRAEPDPPDTIQMLIDAYRDATHVEIWDIASSVRVSAANREVWGKFVFESVGITQVRRISDEPGLRELFESLTFVSEDELWPWSSYHRGSDNYATVETAVAGTNFEPDLVVTLFGSHPLRAKFQWAPRRGPALVLVETANNWIMFYPDKSALEDFKKYIEDLPATVPEPPPTQNWRG